MSNRAIHLTDREATLAAAGELCALMRVIKHQPTGAGLVWIETSEGFSVWQDPGLLLDEHSEDGGPCQRQSPFGKHGDIIGLTETWMPETEEGLPTGGYIYKASNRPEPDGSSPLIWRSPIFMPSIGIRWHAKILTVQAVIAEELTIWQMHEIGYDNYDYTPVWEALGIIDPENTWVWYATISMEGMNGSL